MNKFSKWILDEAATLYVHECRSHDDYNVIKYHEFKLVVGEGKCYDWPVVARYQYDGNYTTIVIRASWYEFRMKYDYSWPRLIQERIAHLLKYHFLTMMSQAPMSGFEFPKEDVLKMIENVEGILCTIEDILADDYNEISVQPMLD